jgi:hypothetical protein
MTTHLELAECSPLTRVDSNQILDILAAQCVKATFFLVGEMAHAYPNVARRVFAEGHTVGTHSEDHPLHFGKLPSALVEWEVDKGILDVGVALGDNRQVAPFFRVPGLAHSDVIESELAARLFVEFGSDTVADDWHHRISPQRIIALAMERLEARGKGILLLHDIHAATVAALPGLLKELKQRGFRVVHVVPSTVDLKKQRRCGARTRAGAPCQRPPIRGRKRCRLHGGLSPGAPRGLKNGNFKLRSLVQSFAKSGATDDG